MSEHEDLALQLSRDWAVKTHEVMHVDGSFVTKWVSGSGPYAVWLVRKDGVELLSDNAGVL